MAFAVPVFLRYMDKSSRTIDLIILCLLAVYAACLSCMHAIRLPFNYFWIDTAFSVDLIRLPIGEMLSATAVNEHPPFYYLFGKAVVTLLGDKPWAFRATGFIPYIGILILALTYVRKHFGAVVSFVVITFASVTPASIEYVLETRMYEIGCFLVLSLYLCFYELTVKEKNDSKGKWICFYIVSMMTAYTHYYLTVAVCIVYGCLILFCLIHKKNVLYCFVCSIAAVISYLPWLGVMLRNFGVRADDWWATGYSGFDESMSEIFGLKRFYYPAMMIIAILVINAFLQYRNARKNSDKTATSSAAGFIWFVLTGILVIGLVMTVGIVVSELVRPLFLSRYIYPLSSIGWLLFGIGIDRFCKLLMGVLSAKNVKGTKMFSLCIPAIILISIAALSFYSFYGIYRYNVDDQRRLSELTNKFLENVSIPSESIVYSDFESEEFTITGCYFPKTDVYIQNASFFYDVPEFNEFYLVWKDSDVQVSCENLSGYGYETELLASRGTLGPQTDVSIVYCKKNII